MPCGIWILPPNRRSRRGAVGKLEAQREHICLHQLSHILCEHRGSAVLASIYRVKLLPGLAPRKCPRSSPARATTPSRSERAKVMATLLGRHLVPMSGSRGPHRRRHDPGRPYPSHRALHRTYPTHGHVREAFVVAVEPIGSMALTVVRLREPSLVPGNSAQAKSKCLSSTRLVPMR